MKQTKNFNIVVPELGDKPDITQVSDAIQSLEDALAGTLEVMNATVNGTALTLVSGARTTKRTRYYDGMSIRFIAPSQIAQNTLTSVKVDDLAVQTLQIPYLVNSGDSVDIVYKGNKFIGAIAAIQRSNDISSASTTTVATSNAVKQLNDNKAEKSVQIIAGSGLTGGGNLASNKTINVVSADEGIIVNADNIKLNIVDAVNSANTLRPASANAVKYAYEAAVDSQNSIDYHSSRRDNPHSVTKYQVGLGNVDNYSAVNKAGDIMTGNLEISNNAPNLTLSESDTGKKIILVADGRGGRFQRDTFTGPSVFEWTESDARFNGGANKLNNNINVTVGNTTKSTNMSGNLSYSLAEIGAVNKAGDTMTGQLTIPYISIPNGGRVYFGGSNGESKFTIEKNVNNYTVFGAFDSSNQWMKDIFVINPDNENFKFNGNLTATKFIGPLNGNANTATKLQTSRQINGTNFDGSSNITTNIWGSSRNITIGNSTKSVNGSANISYSISEIGAVNKAGDIITGPIEIKEQHAPTTSVRLANGGGDATGPARGYLQFGDNGAISNLGGAALNDLYVASNSCRFSGSVDVTGDLKIKGGSSDFLSIVPRNNEGWFQLGSSEYGAMKFSGHNASRLNSADFSVSDQSKLTVNGHSVYNTGFKPGTEDVQAVRGSFDIIDGEVYYGTPTITQVRNGNSKYGSTTLGGSQYFMLNMCTEKNSGGYKGQIAWGYNGTPGMALRTEDPNGYSNGWNYVVTKSDMRYEDKGGYLVAENYRTGRKEMWWLVTIGASGVADISFPEAFNNVCISVQTCGRADSGSNGASITAGVIPLNRYACRVKGMYPNSHLTYMFYAVGY